MLFLWHTFAGRDFNLRKLKSNVNLPFSTTVSGISESIPSSKSSGHDISIREVVKSGAILSASLFLDKQLCPINAMPVFLSDILSPSSSHFLYGVINMVANS